MFTKPECITMQLDGVNSITARKHAADVLRRQKGVRAASVNPLSVATVTYRADQTTVDALTEALAQAGYAVI